MKNLLMVLFFFALSAYVRAELAPRVIGGTVTADGDFEFYTALMVEYRWATGSAGYHWNPFCGASNLGNGIILTAAHCLSSIPVGAKIGVLVGNRSDEMAYEHCKDKGLANYDCIIDSSDDEISNYHYTGWLAFKGTQSDVIEITRSAATVAVHPYYRSSSYSFDVALIRLPYSVPQNSISLTQARLSEIQGEDAVVIGHGNTVTNGDSKPSAELLQVDLPVVSDSACRTIYGGIYDGSNMLCAGYVNGNDMGIKKDSCQGDSGGPLLYGNGSSWEQIGVVSWGDGCAGTYGVYSDVKELRGWIVDKMNQNPWRSTGGGGMFNPWLVMLSLPLVFARFRR